MQENEESRWLLCCGLIVRVEGGEEEGEGGREDFVRGEAERR